MKFIDWLFSSYENPTIEGQWGLFHISVMLIIVALVVAVTLYFRGESANDVKKKRIVLFVFASLILIFELARRIGVGAMKFGDLSNTVEKDYVFDIDKFLAFDGKTGPYIQYTIARINSILSKANVAIGKVDVQTEEEQKIVIAILKLLSAYDVCYEQYSMNGLCLATFDLASAFSTFYNNHKILSCEDVERKANMLAVCQLVKLSLEKALWTLGIDSVEKM